MARVVHLGTIIQTVFGLVDDDGNAIPQDPITANIGRFSADQFTQAFEAISIERDKHISELP